MSDWSSGPWGALCGQRCPVPPEGRWDKCLCCASSKTHSCPGRVRPLSWRCRLSSPEWPGRCGYDCVIGNKCFLRRKFHINLTNDNEIPWDVYPGIPPASSMLAMPTSQDQTSNCHFCSPSTPHRTDPEWMPILMSMSKFNCFLTYLDVEE